MHSIAAPEIRQRIERDNPWWTVPASITEASYPERVYFSSFRSLALNFDIRRATILLGPRRVGKTVMLKQVINAAINIGFDQTSILYASIDAPIYSGISLEKFV